jgi:hypothetical protein
MIFAFLIFLVLVLTNLLNGGNMTTPNMGGMLPKISSAYSSQNFRQPQRPQYERLAQPNPLRQQPRLSTQQQPSRP